jgi:hypothetical protein
MNLLNIIKGLLNIQKKLDVKNLPSQGLFYKDDFEIFIKKADIQDIIEYEYGYVRDNLGLIIEKLKSVVEKNTILSNGYTFSDIKSIDVIFIFFEIVHFTKGKIVSLNYFDEENGKEEIIEFSPKHFNYFTFDEELKISYDKSEKNIKIDGYKYTLPTIGIENCLTNFLISKSTDPDAIKYNDLNYNFTYFLGQKNQVSFSEIENLIQIFNYDMDKSEIKKVSNIVKRLSPIQRYTLRKGNKVIDINSKINLEKIWK